MQAGCVVCLEDMREKALKRPQGKWKSQCGVGTIRVLSNTVAMIRNQVEGGLMQIVGKGYRMYEIIPTWILEMWWRNFHEGINFEKKGNCLWDWKINHFSLN